jgi:hypothetical protein
MRTRVWLVSEHDLEGDSEDFEFKIAAKSKRALCDLCITDLFTHEPAKAMVLRLHMLRHPVYLRCSIHDVREITTSVIMRNAHPACSVMLKTEKKKKKKNSSFSRSWREISRLRRYFCGES